MDSSMQELKSALLSTASTFVKSFELENDVSSKVVLLFGVIDLNSDVPSESLKYYYLCLDRTNLSFLSVKADYFGRLCYITI
jgi:hypothetical protein